MTRRVEQMEQVWRLLIASNNEAACPPSTSARGYRCRRCRAGRSQRLRQQRRRAHAVGRRHATPGGRDAAVNAEDCDPANALLAPEREGFCGHLTLSDVVIEKANFDPTWNAYGAGVTISFTPHGGDGSLLEGRQQGWNYYLNRPSTSAPWRISNEGVT